MFERILEQNCQTFDNFNFEFSMSHHNAHYQPYKKAPVALKIPVVSTRGALVFPLMMKERLRLRFRLRLPIGHAMFPHPSDQKGHMYL